MTLNCVFGIVFVVTFNQVLNYSKVRKEIKTMKKLLALLMAFALVFSLVACGGKEDTGATSPAGETVPPEQVDNAMDDFFAEETTAADAATTAPSESEVATDPNAPTDADATTAPVETTTAAPVVTMTQAEFAAFLNAETAKIAKANKYSFNRTCKYINPIDVGNATDTLNGIISAIDENSNLDTVVGDFLGIGTKTGTLPKDELDDQYKIKATTLQAADLGNFKASGNTYSFTLAKATNPKKTGATPLSRFTNDFITHEEVVDGITSMTNLIKVNSTTVNYDKIQVQVTVADGKITSIKYAYAFDAQLSLKAVVTINGTGSAMTQAAYTAIKY